MIEITEMDAVGYATLDAELRFIGANSAFLHIVRMPRAVLLGKHISEVFGAAPALQTMAANAVELGVRSRTAGQTVVFEHWPKWEEHSYDFSVHPLGEPAEANTHVLLRISEAIPKPETEGITSLLRHTQGPDPVPMFSGEDSAGRKIDVFVHPAASQFTDRLVLLAVLRDGGGSATFEVPASMLSRIVIAHLLHVKS